jgi:hypothetical protein
LPFHREAVVRGAVEGSAFAISKHIIGPGGADMKVAPNPRSSFRGFPLPQRVGISSPVLSDELLAPALSSNLQPRTSNLQFLIANPRLRFCLNKRKQSRLKISNRERMAIFRSAGSYQLQLCLPPVASSSSSNLQPRTSNLQFLIETLTISKIESTRTKHATKQISNRYKNGISANSQVRSSASIHLAASYPFAQFPNHLRPQPSQMLPLEIAPRRLG